MKKSNLSQNPAKTSCHTKFVHHVKYNFFQNSFKLKENAVQMKTSS